MSPNEAAEVMATVAASWPGGDWSVLTQRIWLNEFKNCETKAAEQAVVALIRTSTHIPAIADFVQAYKGFRIRMDDGPKALSAPACMRGCVEGWIETTDKHNRMHVERCGCGGHNAYSPTTSPEDAKANLAKLRDVIAEAPTRRKSA